MTTTTQDKRLNHIETRLTPKQWAIRMLDEVRSYPSLIHALKAMVAKPLQESMMMRGFDALAEQAKERHPGNQSEAIEERQRLGEALYKEFCFLKWLPNVVRMEIENSTQILGTRVALKLSQLHALMMQDAYGQTARKAIAWIQQCDTADSAKTANRQALVAEMAAYVEVDWETQLADRFGYRLSYLGIPSALEEWVDETKGLASDIFALKAAVESIQDKYYDGHSILHLEGEAELKDSIKVLVDGVTIFNEYLKTRESVLQAGQDPKNQEAGSASAMSWEPDKNWAIDIAAIQADAKGKPAAKLAGQWFEKAKTDIIRNEHRANGDDAQYAFTRLRQNRGLQS